MFCSFKQNCTAEIWILKKKSNCRKIHIKDSFSILFSAIIDVEMYTKVKSYVTFKNICQI